MKRSEINLLIQEASDFFEDMGFKLPKWAFWKPDQWAGKFDICSEIVDNQLGWDITDFGSNEFDKRGLMLFTLRNGNLEKDIKNYCEKIMMVKEGQETPMHLHWNKMEDLINRGGGNIIMELYCSTNDEKLSDEPVAIRMDGIRHYFAPGTQVILTPGDSICLEQRIYHRFWAEEGKGDVLLGEVSAVNDDHLDNFFYEKVGRFPEIAEDEDPKHLLVSDYQKYIFA